ncbi:MAG TPA: hypothetical protein PLX15_04610 [Candidatus Woesearchaeota archaeon]|nr:hypothetical protein [Candidatus Woesearchaeota archaeon]
MKGKRAQAAMEFLMTYGWAILIILVAIAALAYFGVLNPARYVADSCTLSLPFVCKDFSVRSTGIQLVIFNGGVDPITVTEVDATDFAAGCLATSLSQSIPSGAQGTFTITCTLTPTKDKLSGDLKVTYTSASGLSKVEMGQLYSKIGQ